MTAPVVECPDDRIVVCRVRPAAAALYPLANRAGIELLGLMVAARGHWLPLTAQQRRALRDGYLAALTAAADVEDGAEVPLPELPAGTHPATVRSLERRRLADRGRLTPLGVEVVAYAGDVRTVATVPTRGGRL